MSVLEAIHISKTYTLGEDMIVRALDDVSLKIEQGEMIAIIGQSGSGKSTLMHSIGLLDLSDTGEIIVNGTRVVDMDENELARIRNKEIGFVFQSFNLLSRTTALENVELPLIYAGIAAEERKRRAVEALTRVGLGDRLSHTPNQLSGGQQQRVAIARALIAEPSIILADEPTGNLDSRSGIEIMAFLQRLNKAGATIVLVTHDQIIAHHATRIVTLSDGKIISDEQVAPKDRIMADAEEGL